MRGLSFGAVVGEFLVKMDSVIIKLAVGLGMQTAIGWFAPLYFGVVNVLPMLLTLFYHADKSSEYKAVKFERRTYGNMRPNPSYDFIIVGGGSAASVLANRLSKDYKVLLLERGGEPNPLTLVPGLQSQLLGRPELDYSYKTVPQNFSCMACNNRQMIFHAGSGLGGSSVIDDQMYIRPSPLYFHKLAAFLKDERWSYDHVLPYLLRSERLCNSSKSNSDEITPSIMRKYHNSKGELPVGPSPYTPLVSQFLETLSWGRVIKGDLNAPYYEPIGDSNTFVHKNGRRVNAYKAFVEPILDDRISLTVMKYARVTQILFEAGTNQVTGVKFERFGRIEMARASKEVILSAGAIETPKLLLLSGIGPKSDLTSLKIPCRVNLPVGKNLQTHVGTMVGPFVVNKPLSIIPERDINDEAVNLFLKNGTGPLSAANPRANALWVSSRAANSGEKEWPDIHIHFYSNGVGQNPDEEYYRLHNMRSEVMRRFLEPVKGSDAFSFMLYPGRPKSTGVIRLKSSNYMDDPLIDPRAFEDSARADIKTILEGIQRVVYMSENAPSFKRMGTRLSPVPFPTCRDYTFKSEDYWECVVRQLTIVSASYSGTAPMGPENSPNAVVNSELCVLGTKGLRVVDASILPFSPSTNTYATTLMIAEKGADFIIKAHLDETDEQHNHKRYRQRFRKT